MRRLGILLLLLISSLPISVFGRNLCGCSGWRPSEGAVGAGVYCSNQGAPNCEPGYQVTGSQSCPALNMYIHYTVTGGGGGGGGGDVTIGDTNVNQPPPKGGIIKMKTPDDIIEKAMGLTYSHRQSINLKEFSPKSSSHFSIKPSQIARIKICSSKLKGLLIGILITYIVILLSFLNIADTVIKSQHLANIVTHITKGVFTIIINLLHAYLPIITYLMKLIQTKEKPLLYKRKEGQQKPRWQIWAIARAPPN